VTTQTEPWSEFWKFRGIDERFEQILVEKKLWFSAPEHFNDPFDCQVDIDQTFSAVRSELREHLDAEFAAMVAHVEEHVRSTRYAYLCMCKIWHQTLMWSHYGGNHRGAALGFTFESDSPFRIAELTYGDVVYKTSALRDQMGHVNEAFGLSRQFPPGAPGLMWAEGLQLSEGFHDALMRLYEIVRFMKAECWSYEEEFRFEATIEDPAATGVVRDFAPQDLKHVLFGTLCPDADVGTIQGLLSGPEWEHVQYWKCGRDSVNLVLNAERIT
jgi:hypothetical protein